MPVDIIKAGHKLYIANKRSNNITVYNTITDESYNINTRGIHPSAVSYNRVKDVLYAANMGSSNVAVIDMKQNKVTEKIPTGKWPSDLYLTPDNKYLYVSCQYTNTVELIDAMKQKHLFTKIDTGISPVRLVPLNKRHIAIINEWEYAFNHQSTIIIFDTDEYTLKTSIRVDGGIYDGMLSKSKKYLYVSVPLKDKLLFIDIKKRQKVYEMNFENDTPKWIDLSADGKTLYITGQHTKKLIMLEVNDLL